MQTNLCDSARQRAEAAEAERILRSCVHCGFCNATCPTYQELGDELDGPRGRIYLIKQFLERDEASERTRLHLDRCLSCRNCETTCPSGVEYHKLLDIGRDLLAERLPRGFRQRQAEALDQATGKQVGIVGTGPGTEGRQGRQAEPAEQSRAPAEAVGQPAPEPDAGGETDEEQRHGPLAGSVVQSPVAGQGRQRGGKDGFGDLRQG